MDLAGYAEHRLFHGIPLLWRIHQIHHSDLDVDCGTALRHHPIEILLTSAFDVALIVAAGVPPLAVILAVTLTGMANVILAIPTTAFAGPGTVPLPEPETLALLGMGVIALVIARRRKKK